MAWTYGSDLANTPRDLVRFLLGDVTQRPFSPQDAEVDYWINQNIDPTTGKPDAYKAASEIASAMANRFQGQSTTNVKIGGMSLANDYPKLAAQYRDLAQRLLSGRTAVAVGAPVFDMTLPSQFGLGMMDHP